MGFFFEEIFHFTKKAEFSLKGGLGGPLQYFISKNFWFTIHIDSWFIDRIWWACAIFYWIPNLQACRVNRTLLWDQTSGKKSDTTVFDPHPFFIAFLDRSRCPASPGKLFFHFLQFLTDLLSFQELACCPTTLSPTARFPGWYLGGMPLNLNLSGQFLRAVRKLCAGGRKEHFTNHSQKRNFVCGRWEGYSMLE